ncbi:thiol-activated cytolysin family protein [[Clostridium] sordellii ATCC 9714]|nr:thiol-activated cytolysin family protein [[Clostridium] sordellii ATCC 9714] [Paeniclostridium sordellii ATCC 9714]
MKKDNTVTVQNPTYGNVSGAIDELVSNWSDKNSQTHTLPARTQYLESMVYSKSQISNALNINAKVLDNSLGIDFNAISNGEKRL